MKFKGTKGEWKITELTTERVCIGTDIDLWSLHSTEEEMKANAKLIAAAPELLEALQYLLLADQNDGTWDYIAASEKALNAINKALK